MYNNIRFLKPLCKVVFIVAIYFAKKSTKEKHEELLQKAFQNDPTLVRAKKLLFSGAIIFLSVRLLLSLFEILISVLAGEFFPSTAINLGTFLLGFIFAIGIYNGEKGLAILAMIGGFGSIYMAYTNGVFNDLNPYNLFFLFVLLVQTLVMLFFITNKCCRNYFMTMKELLRETKEFSKNN